MGGEFKSFYKTVGGNEGNKCNYPTRLDTYGCGCQHDCSYCYAKSLLDFRGLWDAKDPAVADIDAIRRKVARIPAGAPIVRMGGMTDCFMPMEKTHRVTYETIKALNERGHGYLIVTKSDMVADNEYIAVMDKDLAHIQVTVTTTDDDLARTYEHAVPPSRRIAAIEKLQALGFDVSIRLSPFIPQYVDCDAINSIKCDKLLVEFLRVNSWVMRWFDLDYSEYTVKQSGYRHLPLERKIAYLMPLMGHKQLTICEDESEAYAYWQKHVNVNKDDCCNLRKSIRTAVSA